MKISICLIATTLLTLAVLTASAQTISGRIGNGSVIRGGSGKVVVTLEIPAGLHTNSNRPSGPNLIPTTVKLSSKGIVTSAVKYPAGRDRKFAFASSPLNVYEGRVKFDFQVTVPRSYREKEIAVDVAVRYQACTEEVCYPPKTKTVTLTATVK